MLGVHHATVIRHVDALERRLSTKLFQRHARGYTATEAGRDLLQVAQTTDEQFAQLAARLKGKGDSVTGDLVVTAIPGLAPLLAPVIARFQMDNPGVRAKLLTDYRVFRLEYGEAHLALRVGVNAPDEPDNVVQRLASLRSTLYASKKYIETEGMPQNEAEMLTHRFVGSHSTISQAPFYVWMDETVPDAQIVFRASDLQSTKFAVLEGIGIGFVSTWDAHAHPELIEICPPREAWSVPIWLVSHVDLHRTAKVQAIQAHIKAAVASWVGF